MPKKKRKTLAPEEKVLREIWKACPGSKNCADSMKGSWLGLATKISMARALKTYIVFVTLNPEFLEHRQALKTTFNCEVLTPTEARFGADSIEAF